MRVVARVGLLALHMRLEYLILFSLSFLFPLIAEVPLAANISGIDFLKADSVKYIVYAQHKKACVCLCNFGGFKSDMELLPPKAARQAISNYLRQ